MIYLDVSVKEPSVELEVKDHVVSEVGGTNDYEKLNHLPKLNGQLIIGNMEESDPTVPDWAKQPEKPAYTPEEVGIGAITLEEIRDMFKNW